MVVRAFISQIAPSSRGFMRDEGGSDEDVRKFLSSIDYDFQDYHRFPLDSVLDHGSERQNGGLSRVSKTKVKTKRFRAVACLTSLAADVDVITDWLFFLHTSENDRRYRAALEENPEPGKLPYLIPPKILLILFLVCVLGTFMWLILATDGGIISPLLRRLGIDKMSMGYALFFCVLIEDIPQVILTFVIEDYYEVGQNMDSFALINVVACLYDTLIQLAEAYDERQDFVETGVWCKQNILGHKGIVTAVVPLPSPDDDGNIMRSGTSSRSRIYLSSQRRKSQRKSTLSDVPENEEEVALPRLRFLSASKDKTVQLWDTSKKDADGTTVRESVRKYCHLESATCILYLGKKEKQTGEFVRPPLVRETPETKEDESETFFLTGCRNGEIKLWNLEGRCLRSYIQAGDRGNGVTSLASVIRWTSFVSGYKRGTIRLWELWTGHCIGEYRGHIRAVSSLCSLEDSKLFLSASYDSTIRLWDTSDAMKCYTDKSLFNDGDSTSDDNSDSSIRPSTSKTFHYIENESLFVDQISAKTFQGHKGPVLSLSCVEPGMAFLSGGKDSTCRLWSVENGRCIRVFDGHRGAVSAVAAVDQVTFLTGSLDKTIKIWDAYSGTCLRTYTGHTEGVTDVSVAEDGTFLSASTDRTIKMWVFTAVRPVDPEESLNELLHFEINQTACQMYPTRNPFLFDPDMACHLQRTCAGEDKLASDLDSCT